MNNIETEKMIDYIYEELYTPKTGDKISYNGNIMIIYNIMMDYSFSQSIPIVMYCIDYLSLKGKKNSNEAKKVIISGKDKNNFKFVSLMLNEVLNGLEKRKLLTNDVLININNKWDFKQFPINLNKEKCIKYLYDLLYENNSCE